MSTPAYTRQRTGPDQRWLAIILILASALLAVVLYRPALELPLIYDDLLHIRIAGGLDFASVWLPTDAFGFYRPLTFLPLLIIERIFDHYPVALLHGFNVGQHALNTALLGWLSWRLWSRWHWLLATGLLFVTYPFAYQAISVYGHNVHPATTGILLLALHTYLTALRAEGRVRLLWWTFTWGLFFLGLLSHESAILFGVSAALVHFNEKGTASLSLSGAGAFYRQPWFGFLAAGLIYLVFYQFLPLSRAPQASFASEALQTKALYLIQGAAYPIAWFGRWLFTDLNFLFPLIGFSVMVGLTVWSAADPQNRLPLLMGWGWWSLAVLLVAIPLSASYLLHGPRLLYLSSASLALLWPVLLEPLFQVRRVGRALWFASLFFLFLTSWIFVRDRLAAYETLTEPVAVIKEAMRGLPQSQGVTLINFPQWLSPAANTYPIGVEFVSMLGDYLFADELIVENLVVNHPVRALVVPDLLAAREYQYAVHDQAPSSILPGDWASDGSHIFITLYREDGPSTIYTGSIHAGIEGGDPLALFGPYELLAAEAYQCGDNLHIISTWRVRSENGDQVNPPPTTSLFAQLLDSQGRLIDQADGPPLGLRPDLLTLPKDWRIVDRRIMLSKEPHPGDLILGVYDYLSGDRYPLEALTGDEPMNDSLQVDILPCP